MKQLLTTLPILLILLTALACYNVADNQRAKNEGQLTEAIAESVRVENEIRALELTPTPLPPTLAPTSTPLPTATPIPPTPTIVLTERRQKEVFETQQAWEVERQNANNSLEALIVQAAAQGLTNELQALKLVGDQLNNARSVEEVTAIQIDIDKLASQLALELLEIEKQQAVDAAKHDAEQTKAQRSLEEREFCKAQEKKLRYHDYTKTLVENDGRCSQWPGTPPPTPTPTPQPNDVAQLPRYVGPSPSEEDRSLTLWASDWYGKKFDAIKQTVYRENNRYDYLLFTVEQTANTCLQYNFPELSDYQIFAYVDAANSTQPITAAQSVRLEATNKYINFVPKGRQVYVAITAPSFPPHGTTMNYRQSSNSRWHLEDKDGDGKRETMIQTPFPCSQRAVQFPIE